jgi:hypothetical protein
MSDSRDRVDAHSAADSLRTDFEKLIEVFDRQLATPSQTDAAIRTQITEARLAAQRGLELTQRLARLLGTGG